MPLSRRQFLATPAVAAAAATLLDTEDAAAQGASPASARPAAPEMLPPPAIEVIALNRMAYGPRPGDLDRVRTMGLQAYVDEQLAPVDSQDTDCNGEHGENRARFVSPEIRQDFLPAAAHDGTPRNAIFSASCLSAI